jgi:Lrp/AsnC family transcriptional regulator, leucine-responsive regulatory protein
VPITVANQNKNTRSRSISKQPVAGRPRRAVELDALDRRLLARLQDDARRPAATLARTLKLSGPGLQKRLRKLEARGVIVRYAAIVDREAVGLDLLCFIHVMLAHHRPESIRRFPDRVRGLREVLECHFLTGEFDYLLKVVVAGHDELERFLFERLMTIPGVDRTRTSIVVKEVKATTALPIG